MNTGHTVRTFEFEYSIRVEYVFIAMLVMCSAVIRRSVRVCRIHVDFHVLVGATRRSIEAQESPARVRSLVDELDEMQSASVAANSTQVCDGQQLLYAVTLRSMPLRVGSSVDTRSLVRFPRHSLVSRKTVVCVNSTAISLCVPAVSLRACR